MRCFSRLALFFWASNLWLPVGRLSCSCPLEVDVGLTEEADEEREALVVPEAFELDVDLVTEEDLVAEADALDDEVFVAAPLAETLAEVDFLEIPVLWALVDDLVADGRALLDRAGLLEVVVL